MSKIIYTKQGESAEIIESLSGGRYLIDLYYTYEDYDSGDSYEELSGNTKIVNEIFKSPPISFKSKEIDELEAQIRISKTELEGVKKDISAANSDKRTAERQKTDIQKLVFDKRDLLKHKTISFFIKDSIEYHMLDSHQTSRISLNFTITPNGFGGYEITYSMDSYRDKYKIDQTLGLIYDATEEDLEKIKTQRVHDLGDKILDNYLRTLDEKYLSGAQIKIKHERALEKEQKEVDRYSELLKQHKVNLKELKNN